VAPSSVGFSRRFARREIPNPSAFDDTCVPHTRNANIPPVHAISGETTVRQDFKTRNPTCSSSFVTEGPSIRTRRQQRAELQHCNRSYLDWSASKGHSFRAVFELWTWRRESGAFEFDWVPMARRSSSHAAGIVDTPSHSVRPTTQSHERFTICPMHGLVSVNASRKLQQVEADHRTINGLEM
jgi:hypothetical protein